MTIGDEPVTPVPLHSHVSQPSSSKVLPASSHSQSHDKSVHSRKGTCHMTIKSVQSGKGMCHITAGCILGRECTTWQLGAFWEGNAPHDWWVQPGKKTRHMAAGCSLGRDASHGSWVQSGKGMRHMTAGCSLGRKRGAWQLGAAWEGNASHDSWVSSGKMWKHSG